MRLAVNIDHIATIREARQAREPEPVAAAILAELAGAQGITVHLRGDRRHIKERDVEVLRQVVSTKLNIEMAATAEMTGIAARIRPDQVTLVPEQPHELTTQGGLDVLANRAAVGDAVAALRAAGIRVSIFIDPDPAQVTASKDVGADAVEINTGGYADASPAASQAHLAAVADVASTAAALGLEVLAGHGLTYVNVHPIAALRDIEELNIGHSIVARASLVGLERAVREMVALLEVAAVRRALQFATLFALVASLAVAATPQEVSFQTDDGVVIAGALYLPGRPGPGIVLLHALSRTHEDWSTVASRLADAGFAVLAIDLRGHGGSGPLPEGTTLDDLTPMIADVRAARAFLATRREAIPGRVGIAGASIGANLAILTAAADGTVRSLALLSPGIDYRGLRPEAAIRKYGGRPALIVASQEDNYAAGSARQLAVAGAGPGIGIRDLRILNGAGHGTSMLARQPDLASSLVDWFRRTLL